MMTIPEYDKFLKRKSQLGSIQGFKPTFVPDYLFDFQAALADWSIWKGRAAELADCGLGKTILELVWSQNVVEHTNKPVLIATPLAVSAQTIREGDKFGVDCVQSRDGKFKSKHKIVVTNYERLHYFNAQDFSGMVCDESSCLKNFDGVRRGAITEFMRKMPYRLLGTATASPNDHIELGTHSEALGELGYMDMLNRFFKNDNNNSSTKRYRGEAMKWRFKGHAEIPFWRWVCSWARAVRRPSDMGFKDGKFVLPELVEKQHLVEVYRNTSGDLFPSRAYGLKEQRVERRDSIRERCEKVAELVSVHKDQSLVWCHLNPEGDLLSDLIKDAVQVKGSQSDEFKEETFLAFASGEIKNLVTKPKIGAFGLNFQRCHHETFFPSHSWEQYYQGVRRCWRFGQQHSVLIDIVTTEGEKAVLNNLQRKAQQADRMFTSLVAEMNNVLKISYKSDFNERERIPAWL